MNIKNDFNKISHYKQEPTHKAIQMLVDYVTGEIIFEQELAIIKKRAKKGWSKMYMVDLKQALFELSNKPSALKVWLYLWNKFKKDGTIKMPKQKDIAKELGTTKQVVSRAIKTLRQLEIIEKIDNEWRYNPFIFGVANQSDADLYEAQKIWEEYIGHYNFYKDKK